VYTQWTTIKGLYYRLTDSPAPAGNIAWRTDFDAALAESQKSGKPMLVDFSASWCPPCRVMKHEVWPDSEVGQAVNSAYVPLLLDVDQPGARSAAARYQVSAVPTVLILDAKGNVLKQANAMSKSDLLAFLKDRS
jgi:protein disulfide-isomerase